MIALAGRLLQCCRPKGNVTPLTRMAYWRSIKFWALLVVGWVVASMFFSVFARLFASFDEMTSMQLWVTGITIQVLAVLAAFSFARSHVRLAVSPPSPMIDAGMSVETKASVSRTLR